MEELPKDRELTNSELEVFAATLAGEYKICSNRMHNAILKSRSK